MRGDMTKLSSLHYIGAGGGAPVRGANATLVPVAGAAFGCALQRLLKGRRWRDGGFLRYLCEPRRSGQDFDAKHDIPTHG
jgi:hypothetical protein